MSVRIGIDLGTSNSAAAMIYNDGPQIISRDQTDQRVFFRSVVWFRWETGLDDICVGNPQEFGRVVRSIKRLMGRTYEEAIHERAPDHFKPPLSLEGRLSNDLNLVIQGDDGTRHSFWPHELSAQILKKIKYESEKGTGGYY